MQTNKGLTIVSWILRIAVAAILIQTLYFKFSGAEESKYIFSTLGIEPWGRIGSGIVEIFASIFLLYPRTVTIGAFLALGTASVAVMSHLTKLGIVVKNDGGLLFGLALTMLASSFALFIIHRHEIPFVGSRLFGQRA